MSEGNRAQAEYWEALAPSWLSATPYTDLVSGRFGLLAIDRLDPRPGQRIVDIGCGSGESTLEVARRVAPGGEAVGADIAPSMVSEARQRADAAGVANADFQVVDVQTDDLGAGRFDGALSKFGVMFFADPVSAFGNIRRMLRPGGELVFVCWQDLFANEWMFVPGSAAASVTGSLPPMPGPDEPGPFSLADPGRAEAVLSAAGFESVEVTSCDDVVVLPASDLDPLINLSTRVGAVHEALRGADDDLRQRVIAAVREAVAERREGDEVRLSAAAWLVTARNG